jgi:hypothetical protein
VRPPVRKLAKKFDLLASFGISAVVRRPAGVP